MQLNLEAENDWALLVLGEKNRTLLAFVIFLLVKTQLDAGDR